MPGYFSQGRTRDEALTHVLEAISGWLETEADQGRGPLIERPEVVAAGVSQTLAIIEEMREAGELSPDHGYELELATVDVRQPAAV